MEAAESYFQVKYRKCSASVKPTMHLPVQSITILQRKRKLSEMQKTVPELAVLTGKNTGVTSLQPMDLYQY